MYQENTYECEQCGGSFVIEPDTDEVITYCPQCGNKSSTFYKLFDPLDVEGDLCD